MKVPGVDACFKPGIEPVVDRLFEISHDFILSRVSRWSFKRKELDRTQVSTKNEILLYRVKKGSDKLSDLILELKASMEVK